MQTKMLEALLRLRMWARGVNCCAPFQPTALMYELFNKDMYEGATDADEDTLGEVLGMLDDAEWNY